MKSVMSVVAIGESDYLQSWKGLDRSLGTLTSLAVVKGLGVALTCPRVRVITSTKWELNMTRKYHVASSAMVSRRAGPLRFDTLDFAAKQTINENARKSGV